MTGNYITNTEIGGILREAGRVDVLVFDACLMQSAEIAYEMRGLADFVVGSEETSWGLGYTGFIKGLTSNPTLNGEQAARLLLKSETEEWKYWKNPIFANRRWSQFSILRISELGAFAGLLNRWTGLVEEVNDIPALKAAVNGTMRFDMNGAGPARSLYADLAGFIRIFQDNLATQNPGTGALKAAGVELLNFLETRLIAGNVTFGRNEAGRSMADARGLSIYLPSLKAGNRAADESSLGGKYADFAFAHDSRWHEFVKYLWAAGIVGPPSVRGCKNPGDEASAREYQDFMACIKRAFPSLDYESQRDILMEAVCGKPEPNVSAPYQSSYYRNCTSLVDLQLISNP